MQKDTELYMYRGFYQEGVFCGSVVDYAVEYAYTGKRRWQLWMP